MIHEAAVEQQAFTIANEEIRVRLIGRCIVWEMGNPAYGLWSEKEDWRSYWVAELVHLCMSPFDLLFVVLDHLDPPGTNRRIAALVIDDKI